VVVLNEASVLQSGAGVVARLVPLALGSQTAGSVLRPAAYNGAVGLTPTNGRVGKRCALSSPF
jgi:Asp-tRNA(Asn)/Glu-tRNA(Gln) amidotransferase A subunit family amidase